ncbi:MAG: calcium-binding protein [Bryobacteraceae bacterium]|jgi:hypothetical protein
MKNSTPGRRLGKAQLDALVEEATVDAYGESEQACGLFTMMEEHLQLPFAARVLDVDLTVEGVDLTVDNEIVALCRRGAARQTISILDLQIGEPAPEEAEWIAAYRHWRKGWQ